MSAHQLTAQLRQLLDRGYSIEDVRNLVAVPHEILEQAIREHRMHEHTRRHDRLLRDQADFAIRLGHR